jgi:glycosyltransferase involved in cell wall biosynthesis
MSEEEIVSEQPSESKESSLEPRPRSGLRRRPQSKPRGKYCVVIPALNEAEHIAVLVRTIKRFGFSVVVVDDGSTDATAALSSEEGAIVISHIKTRGKGCALRAGIEYALRRDFDGIVTCDGDGQHDPRDIIRLIADGERQHAAMVLGNRMHKPSRMPKLSQAVNRWMSKVLSILTRYEVPDAQCGLRMIRREVLADVKLRSRHFGIEAELLLASAVRRWKVISVPIRSVHNGQVSRIHPARDMLAFIALLVRYLLRGGRV